MNPRSITTIALLALLTGCQPPPLELLRPRESSWVWPPSPDVARVRYLGALTSSEDVQPRRSGMKLFHELVHGPVQPERLVTPHAVAVHPDGDRVAVADTNGACVHLFDLAARTYVRKTTCGSDGPALEAPVAVAWMDDALWVADARLHMIAILHPDGTGEQIGHDRLLRPAGIVICPANGLCYVSDAGAHAVLVFDRTGQFVFQFGSRGSSVGQFNFPSQIANGPDDTLFVADSLNFRIQQFALDGTPMGTFGRKGDAPGDFALPKSVATDPDGHVWVVDAQFENIQGFTPDGTLLLAFGHEGRGPGEFWLPAGICIDAKRRMWVADTYNRRVQVFELLP